jgi:hypothetical protein
LHCGVRPGALATQSSCRRGLSGAARCAKPAAFAAGPSRSFCLLMFAVDGWGELTQLISTVSTFGSPMHAASMLGTAADIASLTAAGHGHGGTDKNGRTPCHLAALSGNLKNLKVLVDMGADLEVFLFYWLPKQFLLHVSELSDCFLCPKHQRPRMLTAKRHCKVPCNAIVTRFSNSCQILQISRPMKNLTR